MIFFEVFEWPRNIFVNKKKVLFVKYVGAQCSCGQAGPIHTLFQALCRVRRRNLWMAGAIVWLHLCYLARFEEWRAALFCDTVSIIIIIICSPPFLIFVLEINMWSTHCLVKCLSLWQAKKAIQMSWAVRCFFLPLKFYFSSSYTLSLSLSLVSVWGLCGHLQCPERAV